ncbi:MAG: tRNA (cytidine(34)-2'-O)-methyltransferase [Deltaproteobacteria bacterium]|nr:tRNA (cytidine(34)-2'-O)-methyltransferase [Deltaproteobacteria bacterium]
MSSEKNLKPLRSGDLHVVLVHPEIPGNTGSAGRTCLAAGAQLHLIEPLGFSMSDKQVKRAGLDYWVRVEPIVWESWERFEEALPSLGEAFFFSAEGSHDLWHAEFPPTSQAGTVLIFGREAAGLPEALRDKYRDRLVSMPMRDPDLRSINLSNSVAVALYEVLRRREPQP